MNRRLAFHEAAHAVVDEVLGAPVDYATIRPTARYLGHVRSAVPFLEMLDEPTVLSLLAGAAAEVRACGTHDPALSEHDEANATTLLTRIVGDRLVRPTDAELDEWRSRAAALVNSHWGWIARVARALLFHETLTGAQVRQLRECV